MHFVRHVQSVRFVTKAFLLQEFILFYLYIYLFNQRRLISKYDIMPARFSENTVFLLLLP